MSAAEASVGGPGGSEQATRTPARSDWLAVAGGLVASLAVLWFATGQPQVVAGFAGGTLALGGLGWTLARRRGAAREPEWALPDWSVTFGAIDGEAAAVAIIDRAGRLVCANGAYEAAFGTAVAPPRLPLDPEFLQPVAAMAREAWREGEARLERIAAGTRSWAAEARRAGRGEDFLIWRLRELDAGDPVAEVMGQLQGKAGRALAAAGRGVTVLFKRHQMVTVKACHGNLDEQ